MIAIYARQSVDKRDSISIESQIDACKSEIKNLKEAVNIYKDKGYSGSNTLRPEFQNMMRDISSGKITRIVVYKLDRISRSLVDFSNIIDKIEKIKLSLCL